MASLKDRVKHLLEYTGTGRWIYTRRVLMWAFDRDVVGQLPFELRVFCYFVRCHCRVSNTQAIVFGHGVYRLSRGLGLGRLQKPVPLQLAGGTVWLNLAYLPKSYCDIVVRP